MFTSAAPMNLRKNEVTSMASPYSSGDRQECPDIHGILVPGQRGQIFATLYTSAGKGPRPIVLLMHGIPGHEQNADLAQALRRAGFHVFLFHYSGCWGSDGTYSLAHNLEDADAVLDYVLNDKTHDFDKQRIFAAGHSLGGFVCAQLAAKRPEISAAALLMPCDIGGIWLVRQQKPEAFNLLRDVLEDSAAWLNGTSRGALCSELGLHAREYALSTTADDLKQKPLLLVAASFDTCTPPEWHCEPFARSIQAAGGTKLQQMSLPTDHSASDCRMELIETVTRFFAGLAFLGSAHITY